MTRVVVVGNGMAGARFTQEVRARDPQRRVHLTVFGAEPHAPYNRVLLSHVLAGTARSEDIGLSGASWYREHGVDLRLGVRVTAVDRAARCVHATDGTTVPYDVLVLATGSVAAVPPVRGLTSDSGDLTEGAAVFRTVDDCTTILDAARSAERAVVLGGGLLGLEAARGLTARGLQVEVVHMSPHLMDRQLDEVAGRVLSATLQRLGVQVRVGVTAVEVTGGDRVRGIRLDDGTVLGADALVVACGVRPDVALARAAGLTVDRGVVVDDRLRSVDDPAVRAIGECAQHAGEVYELVQPAWEQAQVLADLVTGASERARYTGSRRVARLKAAGVDLAAMGETQAHLDGDTEVVQFADPARGTYKKLVIRDERIVGAILLGRIDTVGTVTQLYDRAARVPSDRLPLLFSGMGARPESVSPARMPDRATVCRCNGVTKADITRCWLAGARSVARIVDGTRATTGCGSCRDVVEGLVEFLAESDTEEVPA